MVPKKLQFINRMLNEVGWDNLEMSPEGAIWYAAYSNGQFGLYLEFGHIEDVLTSKGATHGKNSKKA